MQHILIVDDDPDLLEMITLVLVSQRHKVTTASCGAAVAGALDGPLPDLILMDIYLGDADGWISISAMQTAATSAVS